MIPILLAPSTSATAKIGISITIPERTEITTSADGSIDVKTNVKNVTFDKIIYTLKNGVQVIVLEPK